MYTIPGEKPSPVDQAAYPSSRARARRTCASGSSKWRRCAAIRGRNVCGDNETLPAIAGTAMEDPASGWFLFWASRTPAEEQTWELFTQDAFAHFEASNYQAILRQKLRQLRQVDDIKDYNGNGAMDQAVKYEMPHFGGDRKVRREKPEREQRYRGNPRMNHAQDKKPFSKRSFKPGQYAPTEPSKEGPMCYYCKKPGHFKRDCKKMKSDQETSSRVMYNRAPLFAVNGDIVQSDKKLKALFLLDCGATTVYVSRGFVKKYGLKTEVYSGRTIRLKRGDNKIGESMLDLVKIDIQLKRVTNYQCVAVVFDIPDEFDCVLGMPSFVNVQPNIDWKRRCFKDDDSSGPSTRDTSTSCGKCSQANGSGLHDAVVSEGSTTKSRDSCRAAVPETQSECEVETAERPAGDVKKLPRREKKNAKVEAMCIPGVIDSEGVETKYITRKKLRKILRLPAKDKPEHDFMIVLTNDTIKEIERDNKRNDEPDNVGSEKAKGFLQTDWESFKDNPALPVIEKHKNTVFMLELPDGLPMERDIEHRIDVKEIRAVAMMRKEDVFDSMAGAYYLSCMDLMSAYYQVRMKTDHIKYTAFQAPSGLYEYLVLPMGVSNAPATIHRLASSLLKVLSHTRSFYDDIYIFTKSRDINEHLQAIRGVLEILKVNKLYVKLSNFVFCAEEIPCLGDFIGRNGVRINPDKVQTIRD
ncbi:unnamed protein product [Phytophthora fragariaefolia]|uniref:Unnamed protein product n=1 Tax=Phytophthora fragariaefolia TaxID=1490495 RepID=A0A9W6XC18_9STRA|nr:unnamed protein product [Phytophthora fragariaefolia]